MATKNIFEAEDRALQAYVDDQEDPNNISENIINLLSGLMCLAESIGDSPGHGNRLVAIAKDKFETKI